MKKFLERHIIFIIGLILGIPCIWFGYSQLNKYVEIKNQSDYDANYGKTAMYIKGVPQNVKSGLTFENEEYLYISVIEERSLSNGVDNEQSWARVNKEEEKAYSMTLNDIEFKINDIYWYNVSKCEYSYQGNYRRMKIIRIPSTQIVGLTINKKGVIEYTECMSLNKLNQKNNYVYWILGLFFVIACSIIDIRLAPVFKEAQRELEKKSKAEI